MADSPNLALPFMEAAQAQKHVTHNEALSVLDALVHLAVLDRDLSAPPVSPANGQRYLVAAAPTGDWTGRAGAVAAFQDGGWTFHTPRAGWVLWVADEAAAFVFSGSAWVALDGGTNPVPLVGVNATADATNRLAVKSPASLFDNTGNGHQVKVNKAAGADTASVLFQTGYSGRAEFGLTGDDNWHVKVSPDGSSWFEALVADRNTGRVSLPLTPLRELLTGNRTYFVRTDGANSNTGLANTPAAAFLTIQKAVDTVVALDLNGFAVTIQVADGTYAGTISVTRPFLGGSVTLLGNTVTPANCLLTFNGYGAFTVTGSGTALTVRGFKIQNSAAGSLGQGLLISNGAAVFYGNIDWGACTRYHVEVNNGANVQMAQNCAISGGAIAHVNASGAALYTSSGRTVTVLGTPAFTWFIAFNTGAQATLFSNTWTNGSSATGSRYNVQGNAVVNTFGAAANHLPGSTAGTTAVGGQYL